MSVGDFDIDLDELRSKRRGEARFAQRWLYHMGPKDAPRLPLSNVQYHELMWSGGGINQITALYARSLALFGYKVFDHPNLEVFGSGVLASPFAPRHILDDVDLKLRFLPCRLRQSVWPTATCVRDIQIPTRSQMACRGISIPRSTGGDAPTEVTDGRSTYEAVKAAIYCARCARPVAIRYPPQGRSSNLNGAPLPIPSP
jgi:hypothetical protein